MNTKTNSPTPTAYTYTEELDGSTAEDHALILESAGYHGSAAVLRACALEHASQSARIAELEGALAELVRLADANPNFAVTNMAPNGTAEFHARATARALLGGGK